MKRFIKTNIEKLLFKKDDDGVGYHETIKGVYVHIKQIIIKNKPRYSLNLLYGSSKIEYNMKWIDNIWEIIYIILNDIKRNINASNLEQHGFICTKDHNRELFVKNIDNISIYVYKTFMSYNIEFIWSNHKLSMSNISNIDTINNIINFIKKEQF